MPVRTSEATWQGNLRDGRGNMRIGAGVWEGPYSFSSRFENGAGTNPEELIGAAHAGCFSMALAGILADAGFQPQRIHTVAKVHVEKVDDGFGITSIDLITEAEVPGIDADTFRKHAEAAKVGCPVSRALAAVPKITLDARLL